MGASWSRPRGQIIPLFSIGCVALLGAVALGVDVAVMYFNWAGMQKAVDAAALAGANLLPEQPDAAKATATAFALSNGLGTAEVDASVSEDDKVITVSASRNVPYFFGRVLGLRDQLVKVASKAAVSSGTSCIGCAYLGTDGNNPFTASYGVTVGQFGLVPIGLQATTSYSYNEYVQLAYNGGSNSGMWTPGNWGYLSFNAPGGATLRSNIANGYSGPLQVGNWVDSQTGVQVGNGPAGLQDRITLANQTDPGGSFSHHNPLNPRVLYVPMVDWNSQNGKSGIQVLGFASVWLDSISGNGKTINSYFISQVAPDSLPNSSSPYAGTLGAPILMK